MEKDRHNIIKITHTLGVVAKCWETAEVNLQADIKNNYPDVDEEFITKLFHGKFAESLRLASEDRRIAEAFLMDLRIAFPTRRLTPKLKPIAEGLIASVTLHKRHTEKRTGGDFGFQIIRPQIKHNHFCNLLKISEYRRGILCQAKLKKVDGKWGTFTKRQKEILHRRLHYLSILLYSFEDHHRNNLQQFQWQLCKSTSFGEIEKWLKRNNFPAIINSVDIIQGIGDGHIGTDDLTINDEIISPKENPSIIININWPEGSHPGSEVRIFSSKEIKQEVKMQLYRAK